MPAVGDVLGDRYRIDGVLGAGGMASVYLATDLRLGRQVAVKVLLPNLATDPAFAERFDREARLLAAISHIGVAAVYDVERGDPDLGREPFYVMEFCDGGTLEDRIKERGALDPGEVVPIITAVADGLAEMHRRGLIHRDVKPANIVFAGPRPKLADFGLARAEGSSRMPSLTEPGTTAGTPSYLAPELLAGTRATVASDTFSLGATTFHALTGRAPRPAMSFEELLDARSTPLPLVSAVMPQLGVAFDNTCAAALALDPGARPTPQRFGHDLAEALSRWLDERASATPPVSRPVDDESTTEPLIPTATLPFGPTAGAPGAVPQPRSAPAAAVAAEPRVPPSARRRSARQAAPWRAVAIAGSLVLSAIILALALQAIGSPPLLPATSPSPTLAFPTLLPTATSAPTATLDPAALALQALNEVYAAIDQAKGGPDGLNGGDAHDLEVLASEVGTALRSGDYEAARKAADELAKEADKRTKKIDPERREALLSTIEDLRTEIPPTG